MELSKIPKVILKLLIIKITRAYVYFCYFYDSEYSYRAKMQRTSSSGLRYFERNGERLILDRIGLGNDRIPYRRSNISVPFIPRIPSSRYARYICRLTSLMGRNGGEERRERGKGGQMEGGVNNPAVSQRVAMAGWIVEEARRRYAFTEARHLKAMLLSRPRPGCLCLPRVNGGLIRIDGNSATGKFVDEDSNYRHRSTRSWG